MRPRLRNFILGLGLLASVSTSGCRVRDSDIETWKGTVKGPGKMVAVMLADKYDMDLRSAAALALVDMERHDVDGVAELLAATEKLDANTRDQIIASLVPGLTKQMSAQDEKADPSQGPPAKQIRAKDAAFALIAFANPESRKALTEAVMRWYTADFNGRSLSGNYSAEQVVRALGSSAATSLVDALNARLPQQALVKLAELIGQVGNPDTKQRAGQKLVAIEAEMQSDAFLGWLQAQISQQLGGQGGKADQKRIDEAAKLNREKFIDEGAIPAMAHLADQPEVANRLLAIAAHKDAKLAERRARALQALEGKVHEEHLAQLLELALDPGNPAMVQDYAFDRVGDIRSPKAIPPMWPLVTDAEKQRQRWRAGELVLTIGGSNVLSEFFAKLPSGGEVKYEPEELDGYAARMGQMSPLPTAVATAQLSSPNWWGRVIALNFFARKGTDADVPIMSRLLGDAAPVHGKNWESGTTVGKVAKQAIDGLRERLGRPQG